VQLITLITIDYPRDAQRAIRASKQTRKIG
jgi:hypothetical protein